MTYNGMSFAFFDSPFKEMLLDPCQYLARMGPAPTSRACDACEARAIYRLKVYVLTARIMRMMRSARRQQVGIARIAAHAHRSAAADHARMPNVTAMIRRVQLVRL